MEKIKYGNKDTHTMAICIKDTAATANSKIMSNYVLPLSRMSGTPLANDLCTLPLYYPTTGNIKKKDIVTMSEELLDYCDTAGIDTLLVADGKYFEYLSGVKGLERQTGSKFQCGIPEYEHITIIPVLSYIALEMSPDKQVLQDKAFTRVVAELKGEEIVEQVFEFKHYEMVTDPQRAKELLKSIITHDRVAVDIETRSKYDAEAIAGFLEELSTTTKGSPRYRELLQMINGKGALALGYTELLTIAFAPTPDTAFTIVVDRKTYGVDEQSMKSILKGFFKSFTGRSIFHNGLFDVKHLVYLLFMDGFKDTQGMREGINAIKFDDSMLLAYCALNSTSRVSLGLKDLAYDFLGDYAEDMKDATIVPLKDLALYNAKDVAGTWYVFNKYKAALDWRVYKEIMEPSCKPILKMMLNGMPLDLDKVEATKVKLTEDLDTAMSTLRSNEHVKEVERRLRAEAAIKYNDTHVKTTRSPSDFADLQFNPNSGTQLRMLLFDTLGFTPIEKTPKGVGKTNRDSIVEFLSEAQSYQKPVLEALIMISKTAIVLNTFIHAFESTSITQDGITTLHGNLRLGGTQSNRLSSNNVNLQNMPNTKDIKSCFVAPKGWLFAGSDFNALELRIGGILTGSKTIRRQTMEGLDGHCVNAAAMLGEELEEAGLHIDMNSVESINSIKELAPDIRQAAKPVGFLKQYGGGVSKIQRVVKCSKERAQRISDSYDQLYSEVVDYANKAQEEAMANGYVKCAFGLRLKTPRLAKARPGKLTPEQASEARSATNAKTQSYGTLMNRAFIEFDNRVEASEFVDDIKPVSTIHDAEYLLIRDDPRVVQWVNQNLIECMEWQDDPAIASDIPLGAELDIGRSWATQITLKNNASLEEIQEVLSKL